MEAVEALLLGVTSGPACLASCGPVLLPWLTAENAPLSRTSRLLAVYLSGRFAAYMLFALIAWAAGTLLPGGPSRAMVYAAANLGVAILLVWYAARLKPAAVSCTRECHGCPAISESRLNHAGPVALGFFTGLNLCPPFIAAGTRAAETGSLSQALLFFVFFFVGTALWFLPVAAVGLFRRSAQLLTVARLTMCFLAFYYGYLGAVALGWRILHG